MEFKFDRTAFSYQSHMIEDQTKSFKNLTPKERLAISFYLNSIAYNFDRNNPPKMDKTFFTKRKRD